MILSESEEYNLLELFKFEDPTNLGTQALERIVSLSKSQSGSLYFINKKEESFDLRFFHGVDKFPLKYTKNEIFSNRFIHTVIGQRITIVSESEKIIFIPICRTSKIEKRKYCIGFLQLMGCAVIESRAVIALEKSMFLFNEVFNKLMISNLMKVMNQPINFRESKNEYFENVLGLISEATGFPFFAIREYSRDNDSLICIEHAGFPPNNPPPDFLDGDIPEAFLEVLITRESKQFYFENNLDNYEGLKEVGIKRFIIIPINVGDSIWGVLSLATSCDYYFDQTEILSLETVGHAIGISINNFRNFHESQDKFTEFAVNNTLLTGVEIAQSVRHEARNILEEAKLKLLKIKNTKEAELRDNIIEALSKKITDIELSLDKIRNATSPPKRVLQTVIFEDIWNESLLMLQGRFEKNDIKIRTTDNLRFRINVYPDWLRHAFLNLLLNSADSFDEKSKKNIKKEISLSVDKNSTDETLKLIYSDNAGGIDPSRLIIPDTITDSSIINNLNRLIFEPNVTSKGKKGSGYGLYLTRLNIQEYHKGTINLVDYKKGVTFYIEISKKLQ